MSTAQVPSPREGRRDRLLVEAAEARPWEEAHPPERILAIRLQALGDTVLTLPYLNAVRRLLPDATLDFLTREEVADIPRAVVLFDRVLEIGGGRDQGRQLLSAASLLPSLWLGRYDVVLDLQRNRLSRLLRMALHPAAWSEFDRFSPRLAGERTRAAIEAAGLGPLEVRADLALAPWHADAGLEKLHEAGWDGESEIVVLNPASAFRGRRWPLKSYVRFARLWNAERSGETRFLLLGLPSLVPEARYLGEHLGGRLLDLVGRTSPSEAFALLRRATLVLSGDSGLMHMAWVAGVPTLALFGASRGAWARPHGSHSAWVRACQLPDGICMDGTCREGLPTCLDRLPPEEVVRQARALVEEVAETPRKIYADGRLYAPEL